MPTASVKLTVDGEEVLNAGVGIGPVDAAINAVNSLVSLMILILLNTM